MGTLFGVGSYFATDVATALHYALPGGSGCVFVCDVITGRFMQGDPSLKVLPSGTHSSVDDISKPSIFVTYKDDVAYPKYLVHLA